MAIQSDSETKEKKDILPKEIDINISEKQQLILSKDSPICVSETKLHKIVLQNFLSFKYDEVIFHPEFTIVTGPNGAGKSSIYQALRFALGSNDYDGRYLKWAEFIRKGQNFARVQVYFYHNDAEFLIERSVASNNTPKYGLKLPDDKKIRKVSSRKIKSLISKFGIDPDNVFSFMSQGNIDAIKDYKEETLCNFVEQGIGLDILRKQILQQKNKILNLKKNYNVLNTKKDNLSYQLIEIKPKLRRLQEKKQLEQRLSDLNDELLWIQKKEIEAEILELTNHIKQHQKEIDSIQSQLKLLKGQIANIDTDLEKKREELYELNSQKGAIEEKLKIINKEIEKYTQLYDKLVKKIEDLKHKIENIDKEIKNINVEQSQIKNTCRKLSTKILEEQTKIQKLEKERKDLQTQYFAHKELIMQYKEIQNRYKMKKDNFNHINQELQELEKKIEEKIKKIKNLHHHLQKYRWFLEDPTDNLQEKMRSYSDKYKVLLNDNQEKQNSLQTEYETTAKRMERLKRTFIDKSIPKPKPIQRMIQEIRERNLNAIGPLIDYIHFDDMYRLAIESIFGGRVLFSFIARNIESFAQLKEIALRTKARCNIYKSKNKPIPNETYNLDFQDPGVFGYLIEKVKPINNDIDVKKVLYSIARQTILVKDHVVATHILNKYKLKNWVVTLDGEQIRPKKYVLEARPHISNNNRTGITSLAQAKIQVSKYQEILSENRSEYNLIDNKNNKIKKKIEILENRLQEIEKLLSIYKKKEISTKLKNSMIKQRKELYNKRSIIEIELKEMNQEIAEFERKLPKNTLNIQKQLNEIPSKLNQLQENLDEYQTTKENYDKQLQKLAINQTQLLTKKELLEEQKIDLEEDLKERDVNHFKTFQESISLTNEKTEINRKIEGLTENTKDISAKLSELNQKKNRLNEKINQHSNQIASNTYRIKTLNQKINLIKTRIEKNEINFQNSRSIQEIQAEISEIQHQLLSYTDINDSLLREKENIEQTLNEIQTKKQNLEKEIDEAQAAQKALETSYFERFEKSINILEQSINQKIEISNIEFKVELALIGDLENLGLEILTYKTDNKKKVNYNFGALSGGQRSMIGICLMLSLNDLNPSPLNIYDECDMFLDEKNSESVAQLIREVSCTGIQFIILMPSKNNTLLALSKKVIGVCLNGENGTSTVHYSKFIN